MCTNDALYRLECYMDELVDCFEDFVKKSLVIISVAVGAILLLLGYLLKLLTDHTSARSLNNTGSRDDRRGRSCPASWGNLRSSYLHDTTSDSSLIKCKRSDSCEPLLVDKKKTDTPVQMSAVPSMDERFLKEIGYSNCSKSCDVNKHALPTTSSSSRTLLPSLSTCTAKHHLAKSRICSKVTTQRSCCSMCCVDDDKR